MVPADSDEVVPGSMSAGKVLSLSADRNAKAGLAIGQDGKAATRLQAHLPEHVDDDLGVSADTEDDRAPVRMRIRSRHASQASKAGHIQ